MRFHLYPDLTADEVIRRLPKAYQERNRVALPDGRHHMMVFATTHDGIVLSGSVGRALAGIPDAASVVVVAPGFTREGLDLLRERKAVILTLGEFDWTDASYQAVRQATRLPRSG